MFIRSNSNENAKRMILIVFCLVVFTYIFSPMQIALSDDVDLRGSVFEEEIIQEERKEEDKDFETADMPDRIQEWQVENLWKMNLWWLSMITYIVFPRVLPIIFCVKLGATAGQWIGYTLGGVIIAPRLTLGLIVVWYFPENQTAGWIAVVVGAILDMIEHAGFQARRA